VAAIAQTEPVAMQQRSSTSDAEISKSSLDRTGSLSLDCDSPKDRDFPQDFDTSSRTDVRPAVQDGVCGNDGNSGDSAVSSQEDSMCKRASNCKSHRRKLLIGRRPQSASDIDRSQSTAEHCFVGSSESMSALEERFNKTLEMNMKLAEKLAMTLRQMEVLTMKLREFEVRLVAHHYLYI